MFLAEFKCVYMPKTLYIVVNRAFCHFYHSILIINIIELWYKFCYCAMEYIFGGFIEVTMSCLCLGTPLLIAFAPPPEFMDSILYISAEIIILTG